MRRLILALATATLIPSLLLTVALLRPEWSPMACEPSRVLLPSGECARCDRKNYTYAADDVCIPLGRDHDCPELVSWGITDITVVGRDWKALDYDGNGVACEPGEGGLPVAPLVTPP